MADPELTYDERLERLRSWLLDHPSDSEPVRHQASMMSLSAIVHRLMRFGSEAFLERYSSHELLELLHFCGGDTGRMIARTAFGRALVEENAAVARVIAESGAAAAYVEWAADFTDGHRSRVETALAAEDAGQARDMARLLAARRFPDLIRAEWIWEVDSSTPTVAAGLARVIAANRPDLGASLQGFLRKNNPVLFAGEPDAILAPLTRGADESPQTLLKPFDGTYGETTVVAAAEWHLERDQYQAALELAARVRPLSSVADHARRIAAQALCGLDRVDEALDLALEAVDHELYGEILIRSLEEIWTPERARHLPGVLERCTVDQPERFYRGMLLLLRHRELDRARALAQAKAGLFHDHETLGPILHTVMTGQATGSR